MAAGLRVRRLRVQLRREAGAQERQVDSLGRGDPGRGARSQRAARRARAGRGTSSTRTARVGGRARRVGLARQHVEPGRWIRPGQRVDSRSASRCPGWPCAEWSAGRHRRARAVVLGRRRRSRGRRSRRQLRRVRRVHELGETGGDVDVRAVEDPRPVERSQGPGCAGGDSRGVAKADPRSRRSSSAHPVVEEVAQRRDGPAGGHHDHTPHGVSPNTGGSTALIPRTKR